MIREFFTLTALTVALAAWAVVAPPIAYLASTSLRLVERVLPQSRRTA
jgi:hypothetical protein